MNDNEMKNEFIIAMDVAKIYDSTVIGIGRKSYAVRNGTVLSFLDIVHLEMVDNMKYPDQAKKLKQLDNDVDLRNNNDLVVDATGVGEALCDNLEDVGLSPIKIKFTGGTQSSIVSRSGKNGLRTNPEYHVSKEELVDTLKLALEQGRIRIADGLPFADDIRKQFGHFTGKVTANKNMQYGNDSADVHDDIVCMIMIMVWWWMQAEGARADYTYPNSVGSTEPISMSRVARDRWNERNTDPFAYVE